MNDGDGGPAGYLFGNGNAMFFNETGEQIVQFQQHGIRGVHLFVDEYPDAPVFWALWDMETASEIHENVLEHIKEPEVDNG